MGSEDKLAPLKNQEISNENDDYRKPCNILILNLTLEPITTNSTLLIIMRRGEHLKTQYSFTGSLAMIQ